MNNPELDGKKYCNCPCAGAFCNTFVHPCRKPGEHYPQSLLPLAEVKEEAFTNGYLEASKAFGGCRKCYGKGYATVKYGFAESDGYIKGSMQTRMEYCSCDRGKQLEELLGIK